MSKELEALKRLEQETCPATYMPDFNKLECIDIVRKALKVLDLIKKKGIIMTMPESDYSNERIVAEIYINTLKKEELEMIKEVLL